MKSQLNKILIVTLVILFFTLSKSYSIEDVTEFTDAINEAREEFNNSREASTEQSKIIDEALSRCRPIIIFKEIEHIIGDRKGIFVTNRDSTSLKKLIYYIMQNYNNIQKKIEENKLPTKEKFIKDLVNIINA